LACLATRWTTNGGKSISTTISTGGFSHSFAEPSSKTKGKLELDGPLRPDMPSLATSFSTSLLPAAGTGSGMLSVGDVTSSYSIRRGNRVLATGREFSAARVWDAESGTERHVLGKLDPGGAIEGPDGAASFQVSTAPNMKEETLCAAFSPDAKYVATGSWQGTIKIWDLKTGRTLRSWKRTAKQIHSVAYSPDGTRLLPIYSDDGSDEIAVQTTNDGNEIVRWGKFSTGVRAAYFSPRWKPRARRARE
jgi:WD40 repeat protein